MSAVPPSYPALEREHGCVRSLQWRLDLGGPAEVDRCARGLDRLGYGPGRPCPGLLSRRHPDGHEVVLVRASGRVQIRVFYLTPEHERRHQAERVAAHLLTALASAP